MLQTDKFFTFNYITLILVYVFDFEFFYELGLNDGDNIVIKDHIADILVIPVESAALLYLLNS